jgi:N-formylglutamate deformylase
MCQHLYMSEAAPWDYLPDRAAAIQPVVREMVEAALQACRKLYG